MSRTDAIRDPFLRKPETAEPGGDPHRLGGGFAGAVALHALVAGVMIAAAYLGTHSQQHWGEDTASVGAIQASMVAAIPLPSHSKPVEKQVLASEHENQAPLPPPKETTQPPPRPTDVLVKGKPPKEAKPAPLRKEAVPTPRSTPTEAPPVRHPQPTPPTPKAETGETTAPQLPEAITQMKNGTATATVQDRVFGNRYAYYLREVSRIVSQNWVAAEADPRSSQGKRVTLLFTINRDGTPGDVRVETRSGSPSLDQSALRAVQRVDGFGPLPAGNQISIEFAFDYKGP